MTKKLTSSLVVLTLTTVAVVATHHRGSLLTSPLTAQETTQRGGTEAGDGGQADVQSEKQLDVQPKLKPTLEEARRQAAILHTTMHATLQIVHHRYYKENESMPLPAATLKEIFSEVEATEQVSLRWLVVDGEAMNVEHKPRDAYELEAVKALKSGKKEFQTVSDGVLRWAGPIRLSNVCLKCHLPDRKSLEDRTAGLIITMSIRADNRLE